MPSPAASPSLALSAGAAAEPPAAHDHLERQRGAPEALQRHRGGLQEKDKPHVTVSFDSLPFATYTTALTTQIAGGNAPDMAWIFETTAQDFVNSGALFPLGKTLAAAPGYNLGEVSPGATERWMKDGTLYAYPFSTLPSRCSSTTT